MKKLNALVIGILALSFVLISSPVHAWPVWTGSATVTVATDNNTSSAISPPRDCKISASVVIPTVTSGTVAVHVSTDGTTYYAYYYLAGAAAAPAAFATSSGTHNYATNLPSGVLDYKYLRFETSAEQEADRTLTFTCH